MLRHVHDWGWYNTYVLRGIYFLSVYDLFVLELLKFVLKSVNTKLLTQYRNILFQHDVKDYFTTRSIASGLFNKQRLNKTLDKNTLASTGCLLLNYLIGNGFNTDPVSCLGVRNIIETFNRSSQVFNKKIIFSISCSSMSADSLGCT